jgi:hypothetical protein
MSVPQREAYQKSRQTERRGVSRRTVIDAAKEEVLVIDLADLLCGPGQMRKVGKEWVGRCPLPDHPDKSPSFTVNPQKNLWICHGCLRGGDVIELARYAWGYSKSEAPMAAADVLREYGHEIPDRPASWYAKEDRQAPVRDGIEVARILAARRRLYRKFFEPLVLASTVQEDRDHDAQVFWEATEPLAEHVVATMMGRQA